MDLILNAFFIQIICSTQEKLKRTKNNYLKIMAYYLIKTLFPIAELTSIRKICLKLIFREMLFQFCLEKTYLQCDMKF